MRKAIIVILAVLGALVVLVTVVPTLLALFIIFLYTRPEPEPEPGQGIVIYLSDTSPDWVDKGVTVIFIPEARAPEIFDTYDPYSKNLQSLHYTTSKAPFQQIATAIYNTGSSGRFSLDVPSGSYLVCTGRDSQSTDTKYKINGCDTVEMSRDSALTIYHSAGTTQAWVK